MKNKIILLFLFVLLVNLTSAMPVCSDTNEQDISNVPCIGFTIPINCSENITAFNTSNRNINFTIETDVFVDDVRNFTLNLTRGEYELLDCANNSATWIVGRFEQGYGVNLLAIILPSILLSLISLFVSGRMFHRFKDEDEEESNRLSEQDDSDSFVPRSRLMPLLFMLFAFIPMIFMTGFVNNHLEEYLPGANVTEFYGNFYILFLSLFFFVFLISIVVWLGLFIKKRNVMRDLDDID